MAASAQRFFLVLSLLALFVAVGPATAQEDSPSPAEPEPALQKETQGPCLLSGLALAVLSDDGTVADILPRGVAASSKVADSRVIVLNGPGAARVCAEFQGYWGPKTTGTAASKLLLYQLGASTGSSADEQVLIGRDGIELTKRGPYRHAAHLAAYAKLEKPGNYRFIAELSVAATPADSAANAGETVQELLRVPFAVEVREQVEIDPGAIEGFVYTVKDGRRLPVSGAVVSVDPAVAASLRNSADSAQSDDMQRERYRQGFSDQHGDTKPRAYALRASPMSSRALEGKLDVRDWMLGTGILQERRSASRTAITDEKGHYQIEAMAGVYFVMARARGFEAQYYDGKERRRDADRVRVEVGKTTTGINFRLETTAEVKPPENPADPAAGAITGHVGSENSPDLAGAIVVAVSARPSDDPEPLPLGDEDPSPAPGRELAARTDEKGVYTLKLPEGPYFVYAYAERYARQWYPLTASRAGAQVVEVLADNLTEGIDFRLVKGETPRDPEPPEPGGFGVVSGAVYAPDGPLADVAFVTAMPADSDSPRENPSGPVARTDENGSFKLRVPAGKWILRAEAEGFAPEYYRRSEDTDSPTVFAVNAGDEYEGIDFRLRPLETTAITGIVTKLGTERPLAGALLWALSRPQPNAPGSQVEPPVHVRALTEEDGSYILRVPAGTYAVGVVIRPEHSDPDRALLWWDNKTSLEEADLITLAEGEVVEGISFAISANRETP